MRVQTMQTEDINSDGQKVKTKHSRIQEEVNIQSHSQ